MEKNEKISKGSKKNLKKFSSIKSALNELKNRYERRLSSPTVTTNKNKFGGIMNVKFSNNNLRNWKLKRNSTFERNNLRFKKYSGLNKKLIKSLAFTEQLLKQKLEKDLSVVINGKLNLNDEKINNTNNTSKEKIKSRSKKNSNNPLDLPQKTLSIKEKTDLSRVTTRNSKSLLLERQRKIKKIERLFDSLEDSEDINGIENDSFYISPDSNIILILDFLVIISLAICFIYAPIKLSYNKNMCINLNLFDKISFFFVDIIFIIDDFECLNKFFVKIYKM